VDERERKLSADAQLAAPAKGCLVAEEPPVAADDAGLDPDDNR
jgi:hypothetical protein